MKLMGIDYGAKRVGVALSDDGGQMAFAKVVLFAGDELVDTIADMCVKEGVQGVVIGDSRDYAGNENPIMEKVHLFIKELKERAPLPIFLEPELMTSMEAEQLQGHNDMHDASAAALILKSYIDRMKNISEGAKNPKDEIQRLKDENRILNNE